MGIGNGGRIATTASVLRGDGSWHNFTAESATAASWAVREVESPLTDILLPASPASSFFPPAPFVTYFATLQPSITIIQSSCSPTSRRRRRLGSSPARLIEWMLQGPLVWSSIKHLADTLDIENWKPLRGKCPRPNLFILRQPSRRSLSTRFFFSFLLRDWLLIPGELTLTFFKACYHRLPQRLPMFASFSILFQTRCVMCIVCIYVEDCPRVFVNTYSLNTF